MSGIVGNNTGRGSGVVKAAVVGADAITGDEIADDAIDSEHYADGSVDLAHMSSESVDEDNLHVSNAGSDGQFLSKQSGDAGGLTWATVSAGFPIGAGAYVTGGQAISNNSATTLIFNTESFDPNSDYDTSNGTYTVPSGQAGKYMVTGHISISVVDSTLLGLGIKVDGTAVVFQGVYHSKTDTGAVTVAKILDLSVGEAVTWYCHHQAGSTKTTQASAYGTGMSIQRIA